MVLTDVSVGESGHRLTRASKVFEQLTGQTFLPSKSRYTRPPVQYQAHREDRRARHDSWAQG